MSFSKLDSLPAFVKMLDSGQPKVGMPPVWSGDGEPPVIGSFIRIKFNSIGRAKVVGYAECDGYLGVMAFPLAPPAWWIAQNGPASAANPALVFGAECGADAGAA